MDFTKDTVLITGASNGIGRGLALDYAKQGAKVVACDIDDQHGRQLIAEIRKNGGEGYYFHCDVSDPESIENLLKKIEESVGTMTILINNAGISEFKNVFELELEEWDEIINTNLRSAFLLSKEISRTWKEKNISGRIVNMASTRAFMSEPGSEGYAASKGGLVALTHALATSLSPYHIRVNSISPGWINTSPDYVPRDIDHEQHLSNRVGQVQDISKACFYLTDPENGFVNGENIIVDGGMTKKMIYEH
ncbi:SDR family oxidoreductase [Halobacillus fulvus]|nr:SDR family oxidoreductase [Halobacillus fulvus]